MKGKGKSKDQLENKDCPLQFLSFSPLDHTRACPVYTAVLGRAESEGINLDEIETLQFELENLLVSVMKRRDELKDEVQVLTSLQEKCSKKPDVKPDSVPIDVKRSRISEGKPTKKFKTSSGKSHPVPATVRRPKTKNITPRIQNYELAYSPIEGPKHSKHESTNHFWNCLDQYCADINTDHIKFLETWIKSHEEEDAEYYKMPARGKHYSYTWSNQEIHDEQIDGSKVNEKRKGLKGLNNNTSLNSVDSEKLLKRAEKECEMDDFSPLGPLTQRLVCCLIGENITASLEDCIDIDVSDNDLLSPTKLPIKKSLSVLNAAELEVRIQKQLEELGILEVKEATKKDPEDEILYELEQCQNKLRTITAYNIERKKKFIMLARAEIAKQELRKKIQMLDAKILDAQRKILQSKQKNKILTKADREQVLKAIKEREATFQQIRSYEYH